MCFSQVALFPVQSEKQFQEYSGRPVVGHRHHDYRGLWGYGAEDLRWNVRGGFVRPRGSVDDCTSGSGDRFQFFHVLFPHPGEWIL